MSEEKRKSSDSSSSKTSDSSTSSEEVKKVQVEAAPEKKEEIKPEPVKSEEAPKEAEAPKEEKPKVEEEKETPKEESPKPDSEEKKGDEPVKTETVKAETPEKTESKPEEKGDKKDDEEAKKKKEDAEKKEADKKKKEEEKLKKEEEAKKQKEEEARKKEEEKKKREEARKQKKLAKSPESKRKDTIRVLRKNPSTADPEKTEVEPEKVASDDEEKKETLQEEELMKALEVLKSKEAGKPIVEAAAAPEAATDDIVARLIQLIKENPNDAEIVNASFSSIKNWKDKGAMKRVFREKEGVPVLASTIASSDDSVRRLTVRFIGDLITKAGRTENVTNAEALSENGLLALIVKCLEDKEEIQLMAAGVIRILAGFDSKSTISFQREIREHGGVKAMIPFLSSPNGDMVLQSTGAIRHLADGNRENQDLLVAEGVLQTLLKNLESLSEQRRQLSTLRALAALTVGNEKSTRVFQNSGGISALSKFLGSESYELQEAALSIMASLSIPSDVVLYNSDFQNGLRDAGLLPKTIELLTAERDSTIRLAATALSSMITANEESMKVAQAENLLDKLIQMLSSENDKVKASALTALTGCIIKNTVNQDTLIAKEVIPVIIGLMESKSVEVQETSTEFLRQVRMNERIKGLLIDKALVIVNVLGTTQSVSLQEAAVSILDTLLKEEVVRTNLIKDKRTVPHLIHLLEGGREKVIVRACSCIDRLVAKNPKMQESVAKAGACPKLVILIGPYNNQIVKQHAVYAIWALSNGSTKVQSSMAKANVIPALVDLLKSESSDLLLEYTAGALFAILQENSSNKKLLTAAKGVEALTPLLANGGDNLKSNAAKAIWAACDNNPKNQEAGFAAIPHLAVMIRSKNLSVQASAASAIWGLTVKNVKNQDGVREAKAIPDLVDLLQWHTKDYLADPQTHVQEGIALQAAVSAISALTTKNNANVEAFKEYQVARALDPLKDTSNKFLRNEVLFALKNVGISVRSRSGSVLDFFRRRAASEEEAPKEEKDEKEEKDGKDGKEEEKKSEKSPKSPKKEKKKEEDKTEKPPKSPKKEKKKDEKTDKAPPVPEKIQVDIQVEKAEEKKEEKTEEKKEEPQVEAPKEAPKTEEKKEVQVEVPKDPKAEPEKKKEKKSKSPEGERKKKEKREKKEKKEKPVQVEIQAEPAKEAVKTETEEKKEEAPKEVPKTEEKKDDQAEKKSKKSKKENKEASNSDTSEESKE
eukprot:TRINITY_DN230_c0_g3_i3.p1 TRINITY_DN230_c0_g3~~TRINITY_DN230_c0_g3_i3.p1  ORF type:complete len:1221 (-),score=600.70 TRINITY_DN230_c0_g3_i3:128-3790(-)